MPSNTVTVQATDGATIAGGTLTITGESAHSYSFDVAGTTADQQFGALIEFTNLKSLVIEYKDSSGNYLGGTIETNSGSAPDDTITLTAGYPRAWIKNVTGTNPLTADVTNIFVSPGSATAGTLKILAVGDDG